MLSLRTEWNQPCRGLAGAQTLCLAVYLTPDEAIFRGPVQVIILLDISGSMIGTRLEKACSAIEVAWRGMSAGDSLTVLTFSSEVKVLLSAVEKGRVEEHVVAQALSRVEVGGVTFLSEALRVAFERAAAMPTAQPRFIWLVTDGNPTTAGGRAVDDFSSLLRLAADGAARGILLGVLGLGDAGNYNANFLRNLAERGGGRFCYASAPEQLERQFQAQLNVAQEIRATQGELILNLEPGNHVRAIARILPQYLPLEGSMSVRQQWRIPIKGISAPVTVVLIELLNALPLGLAAGRLSVGEISAVARLGSEFYECAVQTLEIECAVGTDPRLYERNPDVEKLRIAMELARNASLRMEADQFSDKLDATQRLVELSHRTGDVVLIARYERELEQLKQAQTLTKDQETQAVVDLHMTGTLPFLGLKVKPS